MLRTFLAIGVISILALAIAYLIYKHLKNRKRFRNLMDDDRTKAVIPKNDEAHAVLDMNPEIEMNILKKLENFENSGKYLEKDVSLARMAKLLNTNTKYVTRVIVKHRGKGTIEYITDLKINYIIEKLKTESRYRNYTNRALAEEAGFGSAQNFTRAFKERHEISPTYFISQLKKAVDTGI